MIDSISTNVPINTHDALFWLGHAASKIPYKKGEGLAVKYLCEQLSKTMKSEKIEVPVYATDILVKMVDKNREVGNSKAVIELDKIIKLLKGGVDRQIVGVFHHAIKENMFKETDEGNLRVNVEFKKPMDINKI